MATPEERLERFAADAELMVDVASLGADFFIAKPCSAACAPEAGRGRCLLVGVRADVAWPRATTVSARTGLRHVTPGTGSFPNITISGRCSCRYRLACSRLHGGDCEGIGIRLREFALVSIAGMLLGAAAAQLHASSPSTPAAPTTITIVGQTAPGLLAQPRELGGQVSSSGNDSIVHRVANDGTVDTGDIAPGATSRAVAMPGGGTNYHCQLHPGMIGAVSGSSGGPPPCSGAYCNPSLRVFSWVRVFRDPRHV